MNLFRSEKTEQQFEEVPPQNTHTGRTESCIFTCQILLQVRCQSRLLVCPPGGRITRTDYIPHPIWTYVFSQTTIRAISKPGHLPAEDGCHIGTGPWMCGNC